ncbi:metalloregulator ArsR/SmtB family transcription factor [Brevibacterium sanguinis]|uniref:ArsR/SmtB family transcription factor n=1 Tax=Brevibacterium sanguinis TaxID=232444 RepID=UPI0031DFA8D8
MSTRPAERPDVTGSPNIASMAAVFADPRRVRVITALADGRALPAGRLAEEAGVSASTASSHLGVLLDAGLVTVIPQGRYRYYRLADDGIEDVIVSLSRLAPTTPITSLREYTRSGALRRGRTCYHHLAGGLGVAMFARFIGCGWVTGGDGLHHPEAGIDSLSAPGRGAQYRLSPAGAAALGELGVDDGVLLTDRPLRYCVDWTEQAHHLAGPLGTAVTRTLVDRGWIAPGRVPRSVVLTEAGAREWKRFAC